MNIVIRADRKIGKCLIADYIYLGKRVIDRFIEFLSTSKANIFVVSDRKIEVNNAKIITASKIKDIKEPFIIDLDYIYIARKLKKLIKKKGDISKAVVKKNRSIADLNSFGCLTLRRDWSPLSEYYIVPLGEKIAFMLRNSKITPNQITYVNVILSTLIPLWLLYLNTRLSLIFFGLWVRLFHVIDVVDGYLAKLKNKQSAFGRWIDGAGDKFITNIWFMAISIMLYLDTKKVLFLIIGLIIIFGAYMHSYLLLTSVAYFRNSDPEYKSKTQLKKNPLTKIGLFLINLDVEYHILTLCAFFDKLSWFLLFYAFYFNFVWFVYFVFYLSKYITNKSVKEI